MSEENKNLDAVSEAEEINEATENAEAAEASANAEATENAEASAEIPEKEEKTSEKRNKPKFNKRSFKYGTMSVVLTVVFIGVIVAINIIVGLISERFDTTADLSDTGIYTIEDSTQKFIEGVDKDVTITVLNSEKDFESLGQIYKQVNEVLKKLEMANSRVSIKYMVLAQNPNYSSKFKGESLSDNYIVVECEQTGRHKTLTQYDYFTFNEQYMSYGQYVVEGSNIEQEAVSAIMSVTNDSPVRVAFTEGYGENSGYYGGLSNLLDKNGYDVETINLSQVSEIDSDIDYVIVFAPTMDYDNDNLSKLDKFLDNGGNFGKNVMYFASTSQPETPNIEKFLNDWGISVGYSAIGQTDAEYRMGSNMGYFWHYQQVPATDYAGDAAGSSLYFYAANLRPVIQIWEGGNKGGVEQEILLSTYDGAYLAPLAEDADRNGEIAESGVFNDGIVAYRTHSTSLERSRMIVFGSETIATSAFLSVSNSVNEQFFINMFNFISGREEGVTIKPKSFGYTGFDMNAEQAGILGIILCVVIPVVVIVLGIVIWVRRRHR